MGGIASIRLSRGNARPAFVLCVRWHSRAGDRAVIIILLLVDIADRVQVLLWNFSSQADSFRYSKITAPTGMLGSVLECVWA